MSNLGLYQTMTTAAKRVGGPKQFVTLIFGGGMLAGKVLSKGADVLRKHSEKKRQEIAAAVIHTVTAEGTSNEGLLFRVNDQFRILERDGDAVLIDKLNDVNSPYFVSSSFLKTICNDLS